MTTSTPDRPRRRPLRISWRDERLSGLVWQIVVVGIAIAIVAWLWSNAIHNLSVRRISTGFAFLGREADRRQLARLQPEKHLSARVPGRHRQYAPRRRDRHRAGDHRRDAGRHRAIVLQLAVVAARRGLCRGAARPAAAAAALVLVRDDAGASGGAQRVETGRGRLPLQSRPGAAVGPDRRGQSLGDRRGGRRAGRVLSAAAAIDRAADAGRPIATALALRA